MDKTYPSQQDRSDLINYFFDDDDLHSEPLLFRIK